MNLRKTIAACVFLFLLNAVVSSAQSFSFEPVTRTGRPVPVPSTLAFLTSFSMNDSGQFAFAADGGILLNTNGSSTIIAALRTPAPGGGEFVTASSPSIDASGNVVFRSSVTQPSRSGLFLFSNGAITQLLADGQVAPTGDVLVPTTPAMNAAGDVVFVSSSGLFLLSQGTITKLAGRNAPAPGGNTFLTFSSPSINQSGQVVFTATLSGGRTGIFLASGGTLLPVARTATPAPAGGTFFSFLQAPSLNDAGQVAFSALVNGPAVASGVYVYSNGQLTQAVQAFTSVPGGTLANAQFVSLNNAGQIAFVGQTLQLQSRTGVYLFSGGSVSAVMLPGETSPEGNIFTQGLNTAISTQGNVAFLARTDNSNSTIYSFAGNQLTRIAGQGDFIPGAARVRTASPFALTDAGQTLVLAATFPGGNGLFIDSANDDDDPALVVHQSQALPGGGVLLNILNSFSMNNNAQVAFDANSTNITSQIVLSSGGTLSKIALGGIGVGDPSPNGSTFFNFGSTSINDLGEIIFGGATFNGNLMFSSLNGQLGVFITPQTLAAAVGTPAATVNAPALNDQGQAAVFIQPSPFPNGIFLFSQGALTSIARNGAAAPGGGHFVLPFPDPTFGPVINQNGDVAFAADLDTGGEAVFLFSQGTLRRIAGPGDHDPSGNVFLLADSPSINSAGQVAFTGDVNVDGFGTFLYSNGTIVKIARAGDRVPGKGKVTLTFADSAKLNNQGQVAFVGGLSTNEVGVFIATPGGEDGGDGASVGPAIDPSNHHRAARNGDPDPGAVNDDHNEPSQGSAPEDDSTPSDSDGAGPGIGQTLS